MDPEAINGTKHQEITMAIPIMHVGIVVQVVIPVTMIPVVMVIVTAPVLASILRL
ncbi:Hypothetical protein MVR_LOCUS373 [uncultured virus]|nr:Hypothetical protein MVR_LOCUS373 [uncultured virus]